MPQALPDAPDRDLIATALDQTLFVEAGAGTGKTTALVGRIVALIRSGVRVESIAAITFTEKAAAELAERVRKELERAARGDKDFASLSNVERERCEQAVRELDGAALQTLHSFARKILALYPLEAKLPPEVQVLDEVEGVIDFREHWRGFVERIFSDGSPIRDPLLLGLTLGLRMKDLERLAARFHDNWDRLPLVEFEQAAIPALSVEPVLGPLAEALDRRGECYSADDRMAIHLDGLARLRSGLEAGIGADQLTIGRLLTAVPEQKVGNTGRKDNWRNGVEPIRALLREMYESASAQLADARRAVLCAVLPHVREFVLGYAAERRKAGRIGFQDMLVLAVELLRSNTDVRRALHQRYTRVLIDEFQDTDPLQVELAALLAGPPETVAATWDATQVEPGRLFFVGDPKQSIYRFRRADIGLFNKTRSAFGSKHVPLRTNFRSTTAILDWVNGVFPRLFDFDNGSGLQAEWTALAPHPLEGKQPPVPRVRVLGGPEEMKAEEVRQLEAEKLAHAIHDAARHYRFSDMAILLPTRTNAPAIERALSDAGIPFRVESRSRTFATQDIRDLLNILAAIDDPTDEVALVAALRSAAFACSDPDLVAFKQAGGRWDYRIAPPEGSPESVRTAMAELKEFHERRWHLGIGALVEEVIVRRHMLELALASLRQRETWRRLRFVAEQARSLEGSGVLTTLRQFVEWLRLQVQERAMVNEGAVVEPDDDAIRILTIHAAKGLEFDVVFLAGLGLEPWDKRGDPVIWPERAEGIGRLESRLGTEGTGYFQTSGYDEARGRESHHSRLERDRLLYVAATRARKLLVVSLFRKVITKGHDERHLEEKCAPAECIAWACEYPGEEGRTWERYSPPMGFPPGEVDEQPPADSSEARAAWIAGRTELFAQLGKAHVFAATTLAHAEDEEDEDQANTSVREPWRKGRAGTSIGRAVHAVLQTIDLATGEGTESASLSQAVAEGIADRAPDIARLADRARTSSVVGEALTSGRYWREVYVGAQLGDALIEGFIDLLYEAPDGYVIVDYKTDSVSSDADVDRAMERYEVQGAVYALALERVLRRPVSRVVFVFTEPSRERAVPDLPAAKERALARLGEALAV